MNETFFGPWTIHVVQVVGIFAVPRLTLAGTDHSDGQLDAVKGTNLGVAGGEWTLTVEAYRPQDGGGFGWEEPEMRRATRFDPVDGLVVDLEFGIKPGNIIGPVYEYLHLNCLSADPQMNPNATANPFDFTISEG